jgi:drug/metabolite transporter (DMT)-like permease
MKLSIICGLYGASAAIFGKIALSQNWIIDFFDEKCEKFNDSKFICTSFIRTVVFCLMLCLNTMMIATFLKALEKNSSLAVTVVSSSVNFILSGLLGGIFLQENIGLKWFIGASLVISGIFLITHETVKK